MSREAMQMALDALESLQAWPETPENFKRFRAIEALRARLAQPDVPETAFGETEPVAWMHNFIDDVITKNRPTDITRNAGRWIALYTAPPQRKPLSDDELLAALKSVDSETARLPNGFKLFARAIEAAHGIGEEK